MTDQTPIVAAVRFDGWTPARRTQFLDHLAHCGSVRAAAARVGLSREAAYRLRRRDALFACGWSAALVLAREACADLLASRAIDGVEEQIWYRGELVGTRRKYDSRLLLAHMARLDGLAEVHGADRDAERFDEILAQVGGEPAPEGFECYPDGLTPDRNDHLECAAEDAEEAFADRWFADQPETDEDDSDDWDSEAALERLDRRAERDQAFAEGLDEAAREARVAAGAEWDAWRVQAHAAADRLLAMPLTSGGEPDGADPQPGTLSTLSTSALASPGRDGVANVVPE